MAVNYKQNRQLLHTTLLIVVSKTVDKALSNLFIALLLHKFDNNYCQRVSGSLRVYKAVVRKNSNSVSVGQHWTAELHQTICQAQVRRVCGQM